MKIEVTTLTRTANPNGYEFAGTIDGQPFSGWCDDRGEYEYDELPQAVRDAIEETEADDEPVGEAIMIAVGTAIEARG